MHRFTIDYLTRNTDDAYIKNTAQHDAQIYVANHDGLLTSTGANYLHTSLHLEDVYSVISKDTALTDVTNHVTSPLVVDSTYATPETTGSTCNNVIDLDYTNRADVLNQKMSTNTKPEMQAAVTPLAPARDVAYNYTPERATPSPNKDSGIESDSSPVTAQDVSKTLRAIEKQADKVKPKASSSTDKPPQSYIALIAMAILDTSDRRSTLSDIYRFIMSNFPYYNNDEKAWRNSIRYNLSINECFIKSGKDEAGKGNLWAIHPACVEDFENGDYRRRQARRRARRNARGPKTAEICSSSEASSPVYQTMTPSYASYHPYANMGLYPHQQQMADYAHAYGGHLPMSSASYYSTAGRQPVPQYGTMSMMGNEYQNMYAQAELHNVYNGSDSKNVKTNHGQYDPATKWYASAFPEYSRNILSNKENVPTNNNIVIS